MILFTRIQSPDHRIDVLSLVKDKTALTMKLSSNNFNKCIDFLNRKTISNLAGLASS